MAFPIRIEQVCGRKSLHLRARSQCADVAREPTADILISALLAPGAGWLARKAMTRPTRGLDKLPALSLAEPNGLETSQLIASDKVEGTAVYNRNGDRLGSVYNFMVNKRSGHVAYAVMSFGGFLGIGSSYHPLPWNELTYDTSLGGYVVNRTREQLEGAPAYSASELQ